MNWLKNRLRKYIFENDGFYPETLGMLWDVRPRFNDVMNDVDKLNIVFRNPAVLKVFKLQCDLFSLGRVKVIRTGTKTGNEVEADPALDRINNPNPFQGKSQFLWDFMFWVMTGNAYCYMDSNVVTNEDAKLYFLEPSRMRFPQELIRRQDKLVFAKSSLSELEKITVNYRYDDGTSIEIPFGSITCINDLTNGTGNWFKSSNCIDALYKIIDNADKILDAGGVNYDMSRKFMVSGKQDPKDVSKVPMGVEEKDDIERKINGRKSVHANKSMIEIKRFVSDLRILDLPAQYLNQYFLIGNMYNIPRDVLEAFVSSTYENQEKATAKHVAYTLQPKGNDFMQQLAKRWGYKNKEIIIDWSYLPFMNVFEKDKATTGYQQTQALLNLVKLKIPLAEVNDFLGTKFTSIDYEAAAAPKPNTTPAASTEPK